MRDLAPFVLNWVLAISACMGLPAMVPAQQAPSVTVESPPTPATDQGPFTATFSNGAKVQLIGLSENPSRGKAWWAPNGERLTQPPYDRVPATTLAGDGQLAREICWRWINVPEDPNFETRWQIIPRNFAGGGGGRAFDDNGKQLTDRVAWAVGLPSRDTCALRFSASTGATHWTTLFELDDANETAITRFVDGVEIGVVFAKPRAEEGGTSITVTYQIPKKAVRLIAVDRDGLIDQASATGGGALGFTQNTYHFANLSPDKIERFELQAQQRAFETIEFRNVSLHPDKPTKVEIVRLTAEEAARVPREEPKAMPRNQSAAAAAEKKYRRIMELSRSLVDEHGYRLKAGEPLKRIGPPYSKERDELWALSTSPSLYGGNDASPTGRPVQAEAGFMVAQWTGEELRTHSYHFADSSLADVLDRVFKLKVQDLQGDLSFLKMPVPGDWVVSWKPGEHWVDATEIAALERILREERKMPIRLRLQKVERPVYVASGQYKYTPVPGPDGQVQTLGAAFAARADEFHILLRRTNISASVVTFPELLHAVGEVILMPIVDEVAEKPKKESFFLRYHGQFPANNLAPFTEAQVDDVLASMSAQTGLTFKKESRAVTTLILERDAPNE